MGFAPQRRLRCPDLVLHGQGTFTGNTVEISLVDSSVVLKGLPGPCPNDAMLPVTAPGLHADSGLSQSRLWVASDPCLHRNEKFDVSPQCSGRTTQISAIKLRPWADAEVKYMLSVS
eukprot:s2841_g12.t1